jgi:hypothetical protein
MQSTGFNRLSFKVLEEVVLRNAPQNVREDAVARASYMNTILSNIRTSVTNLKPDQPFVHTDSVEAGFLTNNRGGAEARISEVIQTLNDQNQAALKTMSTIIGRGQAGSNTSSTEARIFAMYADELNMPLANQLSAILTLALRLKGFMGRAELRFEKAEMRPITELEPQLAIRQARLHKDLSLGIIDDTQYHLMMYNRLPPAGAPILSGTRFADASKALADPNMVSPNSDPLGRSVAPDGSEAAANSANGSTSAQQRANN